VVYAGTLTKGEAIIKIYIGLLKGVSWEGGIRWTRIIGLLHKHGDWRSITGNIKKESTRVTNVDVK
jgi:hypothetical protein